MNIQIKPTYIIIAILVVLLGLSQYSNSKKANKIQDLESWNDYKDSKIDSFENKIGQIITETKINLAASDDIIKVQSEEIFQLKDKDEKRVKEVSLLMREIQKLKLKPPVIHYTDTGKNKPPEFYTNDSLVHKDSVVIPPRKFRDSTEHYVIDGTVLLEGVRLDSISVSDTSSYRIIEQKPKGFFNKLIKPNELVLQNVHSNPYVKTEGIQIITIKPQQSTWNKYIKPALFFVAGVLLVK